MQTFRDGGTGSTAITLHPEARLVVARFVPDACLTGRDARAIVEALESVIGATAGRFALFADIAGVRGTDSDYRAVTGAFFSRHRDTARIALINLGPLIRILAEMFRVGVGLHLRTFADEPAARAWLRTQGIAA